MIQQRILDETTDIISFEKDLVKPSGKLPIHVATVKTLATLTGTTDEFGYYTDSVDFYIWLEGCDNEARRAFVGGKFKVYLNIVSEDTAG